MPFLQYLYIFSIEQYFKEINRLVDISQSSHTKSCNKDSLSLEITIKTLIKFK